MHVVAKDNEGKEIDFFVFDLEGSLVQHYKMKGKDHNKMTGLSRGTYVYRVLAVTRKQLPVNLISVKS
jgi:hypothetical protein